MAAYRSFVNLPWQKHLAPPQRVWMAIYPPEHERRLRLHLPDFAIASKNAGHAWSLIDITTSFEEWMGAHEYREDYFESVELLDVALPRFFDHLVDEVTAALLAHETDDGVIGLLGAGTLFGLGDSVKLSALLNAVHDAVSGRLLVFFPGEHENNTYRLLGARDGWNYLATPISATPRGR